MRTPIATEEGARPRPGVAAGTLAADHAFWIFALPLLVLRYRIVTKAGPDVG